MTTECNADALLQAARRARRAAQDEQYWDDEFRQALRALADLLEHRIAGDRSSTDLGLVQTLDDVEDAAASVLDGTMLERIETLAQVRDDRAQTLARAANLCWRVVQELESDVPKEEESEEEEAKEA